MMASAVCWG